MASAILEDAGFVAPVDNGHQDANWSRVRSTVNAKLTATDSKSHIAKPVQKTAKHRKWDPHIALFVLLFTLLL